MKDSLQHTDKSLSPDPIMAAVTNAFYGDVRPLEARISAIWVAGLFYLEKLEENRSSDIKKAFKQLNLPFKDIKSARSQILKHNFSRTVICYNENIFIRSYFGIIFYMKKIRSEFYRATDPSIQYPDLFSEVFRDQLIKGFVKENIIFIKNVLSDFFTLLLCCQQAATIHASRKGIILDKSKSSLRGSLANQAKLEKNFQYGEYVLRKEIEILIASKSRDRYSSLKDFYNKNFEDLGKILEDYKDKIGFTVENGGAMIEYGKNLQPEDLYDQMIKWKRHHDFKEILESIMSKKTSAK